MKLPLPFGKIAVLLTVSSFFGTSPASAAEPGALPRINVKDFGAKGDCRRVTDGAMNKGSKLFISSAARFTKEDLGRPIYILEAGAQTIAGLGEVLGAPLSSGIVSIIDASTAKRN